MGTLPPYGLAFIVLEGAIQAAGGGRPSKSYPVLNLHVTVTARQKRCTRRCNSGMTVMVITNWFLVGSEAYSAGQDLWLMP